MLNPTNASIFTVCGCGNLVLHDGCRSRCECCDCELCENCACRLDLCRVCEQGWWDDQRMVEDAWDSYRY